MAKLVELNVSIKSENDAVIDYPAIRMAEALEQAAHRLRAGLGGGPIKDENGNNIGFMDFGVE